jgi:uncharacterized membrane protein YciS (DUF1049 family)
MKSLNVLVLAVAVLLIVLGAINWVVLITPIVVSLVVARLSVPLGLLLLGFGTVLSAVFAVYLLKAQLNALSASRKHAVELRRQHELAETAERSRYTELRHYFEQAFESLSQERQASEQRLREQIAATGNFLAACIGEIDERLGRQAPVPPSQQP